MGIPQIKGMKHSSLDRVRELERLALRDRLRPDFKIFTGNDLGIDMIEYGSDYLLGLAAFSPAKFAERDRLWEAQDTGYLAVADALQFLGNVAFRPPGPGLQALGRHLPAPAGQDPHRPNPPAFAGAPAVGARDAPILRRAPGVGINQAATGSRDASRSIHQASRPIRTVTTGISASAPRQPSPVPASGADQPRDQRPAHAARRHDRAEGRPGQARVTLPRLR